MNFRILILIVCMMTSALAMLAVTSTEMSVPFRFPAPQLIPAADGDVRPVMKGFPAIVPEGYPLIPSCPANLLLPAGQEPVRLEVVTGDPVLLSAGIRITHFRGNRPTGGLAAAAPPDEVVYGSDDPFPAEHFRCGEVQWLHGYAILPVTLYPFVYYPRSGELYYYPECTVRVTLQPAAGKSVARPRRDGPADRPAVARLVDNPGILDSYMPDPDKTIVNDYQYLIISRQSDTALWNAFQSLATHKSGKGLNVHLADIDTILASQPGVDNAAKLRNFIIDAYTSHGTEYVVLGGDAEVVPWRGCHVSYGGTVDNNIPCDLYFAALDGTWNADGDSLYGEPNDEPDLFAEVAVGRISASSGAEAQRQIDKIIAYETGTPPFQALLLGENLNSNPLTWGGDAKDVVEQEMAGIPTDKLYDRDGTWTKNDLITYFNTHDTPIVNHLGHANDTYVMKMYNSDVALLTNTQPFFVYSQGCIPGNFPPNDRCFAEEITLNTTSGAFAVIMNSRYGWYEPGGTSGSSNIFDWEFMESVFEQFMRQVGPALNDSRHKLAGYTDDGGMRWVYYEQILFGCPETAFHWSCTDASVQLLADYPADGFIEMQQDPVLLQVWAASDCANPLTDPTVTAIFGSTAKFASIELYDDGHAPDQTAGDGIFSAQWTPTQIGPVAIEYNAEAPGLTSATVFVNGKVVPEMHYHLEYPAMDWVDASSGTAVLANTDDGGVTVPIGFPFMFYGETYNSIMISSNGLLRFGGTYTHDGANVAMPDNRTPNALIAPLWTDLNPGSASRISYLTTGTAPDRTFVVEWNNVPHFDQVGAATFEVILEESTHNILVQYLDTDFGNPAYDQGADATAGIEDYNGRKALQYSYNEANLPSGTTLLYSPVDGPYINLADHACRGGDGDGYFTPGETVKLDVTLYNAGTGPAHSTTATLSADNGVIFHADTQDYGLLPVGSTATRTFTGKLPAGAGCGGTITFSLDVSYQDAGGAPRLRSDMFQMKAGKKVEVFALQDDLESGAPGWEMVSYWTLSEADSHSATHAWNDSPGGNYGHMWNIPLYSPWFDLSGMMQPALTFWHHFDITTNVDSGWLQITADGTTWTTLREYTGRRSGWTMEEIDLTGYAGEPAVRLRFQLNTSRNDPTADGWCIDDISVSEITYDCTLAPYGDVDESGLVDAADLAVILNVTVGNLVEGAAPCTAPGLGDFDGSQQLDAADCVVLANRLAANLEP